MRIKGIDFAMYAEEKLKQLVGLGVMKEKVLEIIRNPEKIVYGCYEKRIAQSLLIVS